MKKIFMLSIVVLLIILGGIGIGYVIYNESNNNDSKLSVDEIYEQKISDGYTDVVFPEKLSSVYEVLEHGFVYKNSGYIFAEEDKYGLITMNYDSALKKVYLDIKGEKKYIDIENVLCFLVYAEGTSVGFEHVFILTNDGYLYYNYGLYFETLNDVFNQINNSEKIKLNNMYDEIETLTYSITPLNYNDWELIGIINGKMYSIGYSIASNTQGFVFDEKKFENERVDYVYQDFSLVYGDGNNSFEIEKNGKIKLYQSKENQSYIYSDIIVKNILSTSYAESMIFIGEDDYLYSINDNVVLNDRNSKVKYVLENDKNVVVIFEDGSIKELDIELAKY